MMLARYFALFLFAVLSVGCATNTSSLTDSGGNTVNIPTATFKLNNVDVVWKENPAFDWELRSAVSSVTLMRVHTTDPRAINRARVDMLNALDLLKQHAPTDLMAALSTAKVPSGKGQKIELLPVRGYWSEAGWGYGVIVDITVTDVASGNKWTHTLQADTGIHMFGAMNASPLQKDYVEKFAQSLSNVLAQAKLF